MGNGAARTRHSCATKDDIVELTAFYKAAPAVSQEKSQTPRAERIAMIQPAAR
jgi:hypothetical protein